MSNNNPLDNCLTILHSIKNDENSLKKLIDFMEDEFVPKQPTVKLLPDCKLQIDEKYRPMVKEVAELLEMQHIVYIHPDTYEIESLPKSIEYCAEDFDFDLDKVEDWIEIEPLRSSESYKVMKSFVESLPKGKEKNKLESAINGHKPFANFNRLIHDSDERKNWFKYRIYWFEKYVIENCLSEIIE